MAKQLPKRVVFKGDNGNYMAAVQPEGTDHVYLQFYAEKDDSRCSHTIHTNSDGTIRLQSDYYGLFWRLSPGWIWVDSDDKTSNNRDTLYRPVKLDGEGMYALKNVGNDKYCKRLTADYKQSCLNACSSSIDTESHLKMEEAVLSRRIYDVDYRITDAKVSDKHLISLVTQDTTNNGSKDCTETLTFNYEVTRETKWDSSVSMKFGVSTTIEAGVPEVASGKVEVSAEFGASDTWGEAVTSKEEISTSYQVVVPANTTVRVTVVATEATCEVPFSYSQEDVLTNGETVTYRFDDGIYYGVNSYAFTTKVSEVVTPPPSYHAPPMG